MLSGVMLIVVTMFAVLGAYYLSDLLTGHLLRRKRARPLVVVEAESGEQLWSGVLDVRAVLPDAPVVVLCEQREALPPPGAGLRGVAFATPETLGRVVQAQLESERGV